MVSPPPIVLERSFMKRPHLPCSFGFGNRLALVAILFLFSASSAYGQQDRVDYRRQIRSLLSDRCYKCHGPDPAERQAGLRLDVRDAATQKLESGNTAIVAGNASSSSLVERIKSTDPQMKMPPESSGKSLSAAEIMLLETWVAEGAEWKDHWSLLQINRPESPLTGPAAESANPIDRFVRDRIAKEGLHHSPRADRITALRRITFDLTGLPPTPAELDLYLQDESSEAYEKAVDRLLQSERYGENMARYWLDAVRFGDTHGLHLDNERSLWPYRDWVIRAFNQNMPFDRFTIEQLAGDLLPDSTLDQKIASGFNRCNVSTSEGGSINEEVLVRYAVDRTEAVGTVWMGLTLGCAVCHSHKFDPISQKEFYQLYAFFGSAADAAMDGNALTPPPVMKITNSEQAAELKRLDDQAAAIKQQVVDQLAQVTYEDPTPAGPTTDLSVPADFVWIEDATPSQAKLEGNSAWEFVGAPDHPVHTGEKATRRQATGLSQHFFTGANPGLRVGEGDKLFAYVYLDPANPPREVMLQWNDGSWDHRAAWGEDVIPWGAAGTPSRVAMGPLPPLGEWVRLEVEAAKVGLNPGSTINGWAFTQHDGICYWDHAGIVTRTPQGDAGFESLAIWEAFERSQSKSNIPGDVQAAIKVEDAQRTDEQRRLSRNYFFENIYPKTRPQFAALQQQLAATVKQRADFENAVPTTMVMAELPQPRETFVLVRGAYDKRGEAVTADVPAVFPRLPVGATPNRLALAQWLVAPNHPLTARVIVNRFWQQYFGRGIVRTSEDFGAQGELPSHPELLDWLASEFIQSGWNVKALQKLILMSETYRQASNVSSELLQHDPENILLARGPRFRLDGEVIRDTALAVSGLLVEKQGGRSVRPYQPEGIWEAVAFQGSTTQNFKPDSGEGLYRRSLYTFWKRTSPPPSLTTFDAPSRENCTVRRPRTNTPLQALVLMNDKQFVEAARKLAERALQNSEDSTANAATDDDPTRWDQPIRYAFRCATSRLPTNDELFVLRGFVQTQYARFAATPDAANQLLSVGDAPRDERYNANQLAALTMGANLILNLDEAVTKE